MNRRTIPDPAVPSPVPRRRGDEPLQEVVDADVDGCSPQARG